MVSRREADSPLTRSARWRPPSLAVARPTHKLCGTFFELDEKFSNERALERSIKHPKKQEEEDEEDDDDDDGRLKSVGQGHL